MDPMNDPSESRPSRWPWLIVAVLIAGGGGLFGYRAWRGLQVEPVATPSPVAVAEEPKLPEPPALPPVAQADGMVREKLGSASSASLWSKWLENEDLARRFASAVSAVADGESPRMMLGFLAPQGSFKVITDKKGASVIDPASYQRYDTVAETFASLDTAIAAKAYRALSPIFEAAYREIGRPSTTLEQRLGLAFTRLLSTPIAEGPVKVVSPKVVWLYADPQLEALSSASKHLLRMGPRNQKLVQAKVLELQKALELPEVASAAH
ncbi:MAG: DUF3014 domain-containing protein [Myxococcales bacterium]